MKLFLIITFSVICLSTNAQSNKTEILILGSDHLSQVYREGQPNTDVLIEKNQESIEEFAKSIEQFTPEMIMVEQLPERQSEIDSLYALYLKDKLDMASLEYPRSELYQLAFRIGKEKGVKQITCVNSKGGTSQGILDNGDNIDIYENETKALREIVKAKYMGLAQGTLSFKEYLTFLNQPEAYNKLYRLKYLTPARVTNGTFTNPDEMVDTAFIDPKYIGAELISVFKNRDYKIYSNIVTNVMEHQSEKVLLIIGVGHVGSLKSIFRDDYEFELVDANTFLK
ncbi:DUF5694 domain-containing protein [Chondrinema litorale]|uniref:DUF5694 domain-containing protein n=1 Tax=Chondrinema litorale TaxID=2994555 RepID=UPI00254381A8|nr:DUF5694 domain-containing protein [Chondrinema litorale]UZR96102.1 DUF5694 domain-containing protein [Chondrinema litorale]